MYWNNRKFHRQFATQKEGQNTGVFYRFFWGKKIVKKPSNKTLKNTFKYIG